jgi:hypothetical protein
VSDLEREERAACRLIVSDALWHARRDPRADAARVLEECLRQIDERDEADHGNAQESRK